MTSGEQGHFLEIFILICEIELELLSLGCHNKMLHTGIKMTTLFSHRSGGGMSEISVGRAGSFWRL
jgi:hypothetical protein